LVAEALKEGAMEKISVLVAEDHVVVREGTSELVRRERDMDVIGEAVLYGLKTGWLDLHDELEEPFA
jgi:DNA-binding NarL/FixJ family response regulator